MEYKWTVERVKEGWRFLLNGQTVGCCRTKAAAIENMDFIARTSNPKLLEALASGKTA